MRTQEEVIPAGVRYRVLEVSTRSIRITGTHAEVEEVLVIGAAKPGEPSFHRHTAQVGDQSVRQVDVGVGYGNLHVRPRVEAELARTGEVPVDLSEL